VLRSADAVEEFGLEEARDAEGGRGEGYAEGGIGADEEVLYHQSQLPKQQGTCIMLEGSGKERTF